MRGLREVRPELANLWVCYVPRRWPGPEVVWVDVSTRRLRSGRSAPVPPGALELDLTGLDDLLYLPPVATGGEEPRDALVQRAREQGMPVLVQRRWSDAVGPRASYASEGATESPCEGVFEIVDPLAALIDGRPQDLRDLPPQSRLLLPLIPGLTAAPEQWEPILDALEAAEAAAAYPLSVELDPGQRRWLGKRLPSESAFRELFHGAEPEPRACARAASERGLETLFERPSVAGSERQRATRRVVAELDLVGELWLLCGRSPVAAQSFFRAARKLEAASYDLGGLLREGNLAVFEWLRGAAGEVVEEVLAEGESRLQRGLRGEYLGTGWEAE